MPTAPSYTPQGQHPAQVHTNGQAVPKDNLIERREYGGGFAKAPMNVGGNPEYYGNKQELYDPHAEYGGASLYAAANVAYVPAGFSTAQPPAVPPPDIEIGSKKASKKDKKKKKKRQRSSSSSSSSSSSDSSDSDSKSKGKRKSVSLELIEYSQFVQWNFI